MTIASVRLLSVPFHADCAYDYVLSGDGGFAGAFAVVPFGNGNRTSLGVIEALREEEPSDTFYKSVDIVYGREYSLNPELMGLVRYIADTTVCSFADAVKTVFPVALLGELCDYYEATDKLPSALSSRILAVYDYIIENKDQSGIKLCSNLGDGAEQIIRRLIKEGYLKVRRQAKENSNIVYEEYCTLENEYFVTRSAKINAALEYLSDNAGTEKRELMKLSGITAAQFKKLCEQNVISVNRVEKYRTPYICSAPASEVKLTEQQQNAKDGISELIKSGKPAAALLYGVTGSGKTQVIKALCDEVIASGRQVIMLIPEIALTPQSVGIFSAYYKDRVAVIHSGLSEGEKLDVYRRIKSGQTDMVIGTRSASFAPVPNLGLFVIDEEQEHTYKSDSPPKYRAHDIGRYRCNINNAVMLLSSATPSVESFYKAQTGRYKLVRLESRYGQARLPQVVIADLRADYAEGRTEPIGSELEKRLKQTITEGSQSILFLNRRGYNTFLSCKTCGKVIMCPHCDISLTYHRQKGAECGYLMCHYCGYRSPEPKLCPDCRSEHIGYMGYGTQKIDDELSSLIPGVKTLRMDADTTGTKSAYDRILGDFREGKADVLLGTQMVTKGHDFPNVTLVGVIMADNALYLQDYHAQERTFSLLTQVIGRAGRASKPGVAVIQTLNPEHEVIKLAAKQDYEGFYRGEIAMRKALCFPPFCNIALFSFTSMEEEKLCSATTEFLKALNEAISGEYSDVPLVIFGPFEAPLYRINGVCKMQILCKCKSNKRSRELFSSLIRLFSRKYSRRIGFGIDIDPNQI